MIALETQSTRLDQQGLLLDRCRRPDHALAARELGDWPNRCLLMMPHLSFGVKFAQQLGGCQANIELQEGKNLRLTARPLSDHVVEQGEIPGTAVS